MHPRLRVVVLAAALAATRTRALAVVPHVVIGLTETVEGTTCSVGVGGDGYALPQVGGVTVTPVTASDGETGFEAQCGIADTFFFGPGLSQYFADHATATSISVGKVGVLRAYGFALAETYPESYSPPEYVEATNNLSAVANALTSGFFVDIITPPPTSTAPNPGDPTELMLTPVFDVDCAHYQNAFMLGDLTVAFWMPDAYTDEANDQTPGFLYSTHLIQPGIPGSEGCRYGGDPRAVTGLKVGQPIVMRVNFGLFPMMHLLASQMQFGSFAAEISALGTATALLTTTDGHPVTGASGHTYVAVDPLPDLTVPTTTSTTLPAPTTTTTLPGCGATCGNGTLDSSCGEACDCPQTADPVASAYGCTGADVIPAQPACVVCRGCQLLSFCPPSTTTTVPTTTLPGTSSTTTTTTVVTTTLRGASTTTTIVSTATTTTAPPAPCTGLSGLALAQCQLTVALGQPLCGSEVLPPAVDHALRAKLQASDTALQSAATASAHKGKKLRKQAVGDLRATSARASRATKTKKTARHLSSTCAATIATLTGQLSHEIASP